MFVCTYGRHRAKDLALHAFLNGCQFLLVVLGVGRHLFLALRKLRLMHQTGTCECKCTGNKRNTDSSARRTFTFLISSLNLSMMSPTPCFCCFSSSTTRSVSFSNRVWAHRGTSEFTVHWPHLHLTQGKAYRQFGMVDRIRVNVPRIFPLLDAPGC